MFLKGDSPFVLDSLPADTYLYGMIYHFAVWPAAAIWGPTFAVHRAANLVFLAAGALVLWYVLRRERAGGGLAVAGAVFYYLLNVDTYAIVARPDILGAVFYLAAVALVTRAPGSRVPGPWRLIGSVVCGLLAFYTKAYFLLGLPLAVGVLWLQAGWARAVTYAVVAGLLLAGSAAAIQQVWPYFFFSTITLQRWSEQDDTGYLLQQMVDFARLQPGLLLVLAGAAGAAAVPAWRKVCARGYRAVVRGGGWPDAWPAVLAVVAAVTIVILGRHEGAYRVYGVQLVSPFLIIVALRAVGRAGSAWWRGAGFAALALNALLFLTWNRPPWPDDSANDRFWYMWDKITAGHPKQLLPYVLLEAAPPGGPMFTHGETDYFLNAVPDHLPHSDPAYRRAAGYCFVVPALINTRLFDVIVTPTEFENFFSPDWLHQHYEAQALIYPCYFLNFNQPDLYGQCSKMIRVWIRKPGPENALRSGKSKAPAAGA
jgi:hypothetical protein